MPRRRSHEGLGVEGLMAASEDQKMCGGCCRFSAASGLGVCETLKRGSDIVGTPPVFVLEGLARFETDAGADASKCRYFEGKSELSFSC